MPAGNVVSSSPVRLRGKQGKRGHRRASRRINAYALGFPSKQAMMCRCTPSARCCIYNSGEGGKYGQGSERETEDSVNKQQENACLSHFYTYLRPFRVAYFRFAGVFYLPGM